MAHRALSDGVAIEETISADAANRAPKESRPLLETLMVEGEPARALSPQDRVERARHHHQVALAEMPPSAFSLSSGEPAIPTRVL